jgi:hypothetical protein
LWNWTDNQREFWIGSDRDPNDNLRLDYVNVLEAYLCELFGDVESILKDATESETKDSEFVMAGEGKFSSRSLLFNRAVCIADYHVVVQGPLVLQQGKIKDHRGVSQCDHSVILDLVAPRVTSTAIAASSEQLDESAPVIAAVRATGLVELLLFDCVVSSYLLLFFSSNDL